MQRMRPRRLAVWLLTIALMTLALSACSQDCPSCNELRAAPEVNVLAFKLCVSQVPNPTVSEAGCGDVDVQYVVVDR